MQNDFANTAAQTDIPQIGAARRCVTKDWNELKTKELLRKKWRLLRTTTKNEDQVLNQNNELAAKTSKEETRTTLMMDLREIPPQLIRISLPDQSSPIGTTIRIMEDDMINVHVSLSIETMETDLEKDLSTIRIETGETMESFTGPHQLKEDFSQKKLKPPTEKWST